MRLYRKLLNNHPLANIAFAVVVITGMLAYLTMPREQDPEINFNWVSIVASLPGASTEDIEKRVTQPLEDAIKGVQDIKFVSSSSRENIASILVRFREIPEQTFDKRMNDLRREIQNKAKAELPSEAKDPIVTEITTSNGFPTAMVLITAPADDELLRLTGRRIKQDFERMAGVGQVFATGLRDPELQVNFLPQALQARGLSGVDVANSVSGWFRDTFAGRVETEDGSAWLVRVVGQDADPEYLARLNVATGANAQQQVPLASVASVERARASSGSRAAADGQHAILLALTKKSHTNTLQLLDQIQQYIRDKNPVLAASGLKVVLLDDQTPATRKAIRIMESNAWLGLACVFGICWIFLGVRIALLVSVGIPFSLAGTFSVLNAMGFTLSIPVLLGAVIALGMLVDDATVIVDAIYFRLRLGMDAVEAALEAVREVGAPVFSSVATTLAAFLPLMLLPGILGKFMFVIPFVVTLALLISLIEAFWMLPAHIAAIRPKVHLHSRTQQWRDRFSHWLRVRYANCLVKVLRVPKLSMGFLLLLITAAVFAVASGAVRTQFFAFDAMRIFYVNIDMPPGAAVEATFLQVQALERAVRENLREGEARAVASYTGVKFSDTEPLYGDSYGQVSVSLMPNVEGGRETEEILDSMRAALKSWPGPGKVNFTLLKGGPPSSKPIKVRVRSDEPDELRAAANALLQIVRKIPGAQDVADDDLPGRSELKLTLNREAVRAAGLNPMTVARLLRLHADGEIVAVMRDRGEKLEVRVRARHNANRDPANVGQDVLRFLDDPIILPGGGSIALRALVVPEIRKDKGVIKHYNLRRAITVEAELDKEVNDTVAANEQIRKAWRSVAARFPATDIDFSGELEDIEESLHAMFKLMLFGLGLIYLILAAQFRSYWQPFMILLTVPLAFTGVVLGLLISQQPISLYTLYGVVALIGIAVNSAIVLIDAANERRVQGMSVLHAAIYAARRRLVPIVITSVTTIGGLFSLAVGLGGKSLLWGPVAGAIVWGLGFSTLLTLFFMPMFYIVFMGPKSWRWPRQFILREVRS